MDVGPRARADKISVQGMFDGATVVRGADWDWDNQDGKMLCSRVVFVTLLASNGQREKDRYHE